MMVDDSRRGGGVEKWSTLWASLTDTVSERDVYYVMDEVKLGYVARLLPKNCKTSLEVGCGSARISAFLADQDISAYGIDQSPQALTVAKRNFASVGVSGEFTLGNAYTLPFEDNTFDVVFSTGLLEHFEDPSPIVCEMVRVLKPGGLFWSDIVPAKFSLLRAFDILRFERVRGQNPIYERSFSKAQILSLLKSAGIQDASVFAAGVFPPRWVPLLIHLKMYRSIHYHVSSGLGTLWTRFDQTWLGEWLGFYFLCYGSKGGD